MDLKNISSLSELREQREKLTTEQRAAIDGVLQNFATEKEQLAGKIKAQVSQVRHLFEDSVSGVKSLFGAGNSGLQSLFGSSNSSKDETKGEENSKWEAWKLPAIGTIAGLIAAVVTFLLTAAQEAEDEENKAGPQENYHPTGAGQVGDLPNDQEEMNHGNFERELTLEQQIHAALASYQEEQQEETQENAFLAIMGMIVPVLLRELLSGNLIKNFTQAFNNDVEERENPMQDLSNEMADELEKVKASVMEQENLKATS